MKVLSISGLILSIGIANSAIAEDVDLAVINSIKEEAFNHSQVMNYVYYLADENGARLATSPDYRRAARWAVEELKRAGITETRIEEFESFGRSWAWSAISVQMLEPQSTTLSGVPLAWSSGTDGPVTADVVYAPLWEDSEDPGRYDLVKLAERIESYKSRYAGQLGGTLLIQGLPAMRRKWLSSMGMGASLSAESFADQSGGGGDVGLGDHRIAHARAVATDV